MANQLVTRLEEARQHHPCRIHLALFSERYNAACKLMHLGVAPVDSMKGCQWPKAA